MKKLIDFINCLEREKINYSLGRSCDGLSVRVNIFIEPEYWAVDFSEDGEVEVEIFEHEKYSNEDLLSDLFDRMARAWTKASLDLGLDFISPYEFIDKNGEKYSCSGFLKNIGSAKGTIIISRKDSDGVFDAAVELGFHVPGLAPRYYEKYNRERFVETLKEWGWFGSSEFIPTCFKLES